MFFFSLNALQRKRILRGTSGLLKAQYHPSEAQILTLAVDGQLSYWEVVDGKEIRAIPVGKHSTVLGLDVAADGEMFATGGVDSVAKVILTLCVITDMCHYNNYHLSMPLK